MDRILESFVGNYWLNKLVSFTEEKVVMIVGVKDELDKLKCKMRQIAAYLKDAERRRITDESVNNWLNELKHVMYDADDMIDLWIYKNQALLCDEPSSSSNSPTCCPFPLFSCFRSISVRHEAAQQIEALNARLERIFKDMQDLNLQRIQGEVLVKTRVGACVTTPVMGVDIVGNEIKEGETKLTMMASMVNDKDFSLVAITGIGGIGKTTLAQKIYNNQTIQNRYEIKMWLYISQNYSPTQLIKEAIRNAGGDPGQAERESELLPILANVISRKSFFLVLDDVWNPDLWVNLLQDPLKAHAARGFILVTTRNETFAMQMGANHIHQATILSTKSGWELLCKKAYLTDTIDIQILEGVGVEIVKKCGGLPLAIKAIAGMLATKRKTRREWEHVLNNNKWAIHGLPEEIDQALYLSYEDLSPHLKKCFLYCSLCPPSSIMHRVDLIKFWMAEGFVEELSDEIMENTAEDYYYELIRRQLLEPDPSYPDHSRCKMHDLLRSLARYLSKGECIAADQVLPDPNVISRLRRLSIKETNEQFCIPVQVAEHLKLRTFVIFNCLSRVEMHVFEMLKNLRVLHINGKGFHNIPESIGDLIHLRMLDLDRTSISNLPESISSLTNLLILNLSGCELLHALPRGITRLCNLRQVNLLHTPLTLVPKGLGLLQKLTEIWGFQVVSDDIQDKYQNGWDLQELQELSQLSSIRIYKLERAKNVPSSLFATKSHLKELILNFSKVSEGRSDDVTEQEQENSMEILQKLCPPPCVENVRIRNYVGKILPRWMSLSSPMDLLPNLQSLHLLGWTCCTDLPPLGLLPNLIYLRIAGASSIVRISVEFLGICARTGADLPIAFSKLEYLIFEDMSNWEEWLLSDFEREQSPFLKLMPRIKQLAIVNCPKLRALPNGLRQLSAVKEILVEGTHSIKSIHDLPFDCEVFEVDNNRGLEIISNLPGVKKLTIVQANNLRQVSKLDSVESIQLIDNTINGLPEWLTTLIGERKELLEYKLHLYLKCNNALFNRCLKDGPEWSIIKCFSFVNVYDFDGNAYLEYTREPEAYFTNQEGSSFVEHPTEQKLRYWDVSDEGFIRTGPIEMAIPLLI